MPRGGGAQRRLQEYNTPGFKEEREIAAAAAEAEAAAAAAASSSASDPVAAHHTGSVVSGGSSGGNERPTRLATRRTKRAAAVAAAAAIAGEAAGSPKNQEAGGSGAGSGASSGAGGGAGSGASSRFGDHHPHQQQHPSREQKDSPAAAHSERQGLQQQTLDEIWRGGMGGQDEDDDEGKASDDGSYEEGEKEERRLGLEGGRSGESSLMPLLSTFSIFHIISFIELKTCGTKRRVRVYVARHTGLKLLLSGLVSISMDIIFCFSRFRTQKWVEHGVTSISPKYPFFDTVFVLVSWLCRKKE